MTVNVNAAARRTRKQPAWKQLVGKYQNPDTRKSLWQVVNSFGLFILGWILMYWSLSVSYWLTLLLAFPTAGFLVRIFIIQHDCGHGSFFKSRTWNDRLGAVCGVFTFTPYYQWRKSHAIHHATSSNLGKRGVQDLYTLTVEEYDSLSNWGKLRYRLYRNPITLFVLLPTFLFVVLYRFPKPGSRRKEVASVLWTDLAILVASLLLMWMIGWQAFLMIQLPLIIIAASAGTWLFYVQHQFEDTYWANEEEWDYALAALKGSSYYRLPRVLQWFTGNIGFHHIHHLSPKIPNYLLEQCHVENRELQDVAVLTLGSSVKSVPLSLWDENQKRLISFREYRLMRQAQPLRP